MKLNIWQIVGLALLVVGGFMQVTGTGLAIVSPTPAAITLSHPGVIYAGATVELVAGLMDTSGGLHSSLGGQALTLYVDGAFIAVATTDTTMYHATFTWTPSSAKAYGYNISWLGNIDYPDGAWLTGQIYVSEPYNPQPNPIPDWLTIPMIVMIAGAAMLGIGTFARKNLTA